MDKRTGGIIATAATALFCGCPGLFTCLAGVATAAGGGTFTSDILGTSSSGQVPSWAGFAGICLGLLLVAIPVAVGFFTLRRPKEAMVGEVPPTS
ncbi:MAG TPA: hypothetical protein VJ123_02485 [Anaerolineales bacterium]|nr:hypothetical protein [Anaerolineales bacterium]